MSRVRVWNRSQNKVFNGMFLSCQRIVYADWPLVLFFFFLLFLKRGLLDSVETLKMEDGFDATIFCI